MTDSRLPESARLKLDLMFEGIRYSEALGRAAEHAFPNFYPYRFQPGEADPTGQGKATIPYLLTLHDGTLVRIKGNGASSWSVTGSREAGYRLARDGDDALPVGFEPLPAWMRARTADATPMAQAGVSLHGDMAIVNVAPGCEYFVADKQDGRSMRCTFCAYGAPDARSKQLGQVMGEVGLPEATYRHLQETLAAALEEGTIRHIYLVGGSMTDWHQEGERYVELARRVQSVVGGRVPVTCGSGAIPEDSLRVLHGEGLVDAVCFNLEVWPEALFAKVCPGKQRFVGFDRWLGALEQAVALWGWGRVYSAMVAGVELEPEHGYTWEQAAELALEGAEALCARGIIPIYSLYWPVGGRDHPNYFTRLRGFFERLNLGYRQIRRRHDLGIWEGFMCHRCAYMQLECDIDRAEAPVEPT
jgi:hypothetical protein